jgi:hypothetical protein
MTAIARTVIGIAGIVLYLLVGILFIASGLVMPYPWVFGMWALWGTGWVLVVKAYQASPATTIIVPIGAAALWAVIVQLGSWLFDWTA